MTTAPLSSALPESPTISLLAILALGFFLGMRHATDPDHVVAVSTIVSRERSLKHAAVIGALWGAGHTVTILVVGTGIIAFSLVISPALGLTMEFSVGLMLILLGLLNLAGFRDAVKDAVPAAARDSNFSHSHFPSHGDYIHNHSHQHSPEAHSHGESKTPLAFLDRSCGNLSVYQICRPLIVGVVHGLAGSAAIALLVLTTIRNSGWAVAYLLIFGVGTIAGMMLITMALGSAISYTQSRWTWLSGRLSAVTGVISLALGLFVTYQIGIVNGLLTHHPHWPPR